MCEWARRNGLGAVTLTTFERVAYDLAAHIAAVRAAKLPSATIERLVRFYT